MTAEQQAPQQTTISEPAPAPPAATAATPAPTAATSEQEVAPPAIREAESPIQIGVTFTREDENRLNELTQRLASSENSLSEEEQTEHRALSEKYQIFLAAGERTLREGVAPSEQPTMLQNVVTTTGNMAVKAGKGAFFWGTLVATAVPAMGRQLGFVKGFEHWNWLSDRLILGALPVVSQAGKSGNHLEQIKEQCAKRKMKIGLVVACVQQEEMDGFGVGLVTFAQRRHWAEQLGVTEYEHLPMPDFGASARYEDVKHAVERMHQTMSARKEAVYVHCKAGKGRSWMVVMCYLLTFGGMDYNTAKVTVASGRHQVNPCVAQVEFAQDFARRYNQEQQRGAQSATAPAAVPASACSTTISS